MVVNFGKMPNFADTYLLKRMSLFILPIFKNKNFST